MLSSQRKEAGVLARQQRGGLPGTSSALRRDRKKGTPRFAMYIPKKRGRCRHSFCQDYEFVMRGKKTGVGPEKDKISFRSKEGKGPGPPKGKWPRSVNLPRGGEKIGEPLPVGTETGGA